MKKVIDGKSLEKVMFYSAVGRRKTATARARLYQGRSEMTFLGSEYKKGDVVINGRLAEKYFSGNLLRNTLEEVFRCTNTASKFITIIKAEGSGLNGQLGAATLAVARALCEFDEKMKAILRKKGFMTRDPRAKERKKPGLPGARKKKSSPKR